MRVLKEGRGTNRQGVVMEEYGNNNGNNMIISLYVLRVLNLTHKDK